MFGETQMAGNVCWLCLVRQRYCVENHNGVEYLSRVHQLDTDDDNYKMSKFLSTIAQLNSSQQKNKNLICPFKKYLENKLSMVLHL